jgi:hypothetical protein
MQQLAGNVEFTEQAARRRLRAGEGWKLIRSWRGAQTKCAAFLTNGLALGGVLSFGIELEVEESLDGFATVTAEFPVVDGTGTQPVPIAADPVSRLWKLDGNDIEITPFALPEVQTVLAKFTDATTRARLIADIRALVEGQREIQDEDGNTVDLSADFIIGSITGTPGISTDDLVVLQNLIQAMASGVDAFPVSQYVLRKTETVVVSVTQAKANHLNVGRMLTYTTLVAMEPTLPTDPTALLIDAEGLDKGFFWLKRRPNTDPVNRGQWQITQEYWAFKEFNRFVYGAPL